MQDSRRAFRPTLKASHTYEIQRLERGGKISHVINLRGQHAEIFCERKVSAKEKYRWEKAMREAGTSNIVILEVLNSMRFIGHVASEKLSPSSNRSEAASPRSKIAARMHHAGASYAEIAQKLGVSSVRVEQLIRLVSRHSDIPQWLSGLDIKTGKALIAAGFQRIEEVKDAVERDAAIPRIKEYRMRILKQWIT
jgi:hypothetical protein